MENYKIRNTVAQSYFHTHGYVPVDGFIDPGHCDELFKHFTDKKRLEELEKAGDDQCPSSYPFYSEPEAEFLMVWMLPFVEKLTGLTLAPTYTYARTYVAGETLDIHRDRPSCEISVTANLGQTGDWDWPIWVRNFATSHTDYPISLSVGSAMIYKGCDVAHWREAFSPPKKKDRQVQIFMHYVDKFGPHASHQFDGRQQLHLKPLQGMRVEDLDLRDAQVHGVKVDGGE